MEKSFLNKKTLKNIISLGEGYTTEFKRSGTTGLGREICAFANASGGIILVGINDSGDIFGVKDHNWFTIVFNRNNVEVTPQVEKLLSILKKEMGRVEIMDIMGYRDKKNFVKNILNRAIKDGLIEMTIPDKPKSQNQKYRLTNKGKTLINPVI
jgi:predicted HTH transcriptional regulator